MIRKLHAKICLTQRSLNAIVSFYILASQMVRNLMSIFNLTLNDKPKLL